MNSHPHFAEILRDTMSRVEHDADLSPDDPDLLELKRILLRKIALVEATHTPLPAVDQTRPAA